MTMGTILSRLRKSSGMTQEQLANRLQVSNQAVSKWESDQCCPDIALLPTIADIFHVTIDELFGRPAPAAVTRHDLPWPDDNTLHAVAYLGHKLVTHTGIVSGQVKELSFTYDGPALNVVSHFSVQCGDVEGDVDAGSSVTCGNVGGNVDAGSHVDCGDVGGDVDAGDQVACGAVGGNVDAGSSVACGAVGGDVDAGTSVACGAVRGSVDAGSHVDCGDVGGDVDAGCNVTCHSVEGDIDAGGKVTIGR